MTSPHQQPPLPPTLDRAVHQAAVLGSPIGHSLSPALHLAAYAALGLRGWTYRAMECTEERFPDWFRSLKVARAGEPPWAGLALTMPLKQVVIPLLDEVSELVRVTGAANCVYWDADGRSRGDNTDVHGIVETLTTLGARAPVTACLVGAGATAASAVAALARLGVTRLDVLARSAERAGGILDLAGRLGLAAAVQPLDRLDRVLAADVVVCTLPSAASAPWAQQLDDAGPVARGTATPAGPLLDVSYHPWPTALVQRWEKLGGTASGGFEMLLHQAGEQVRLQVGLPDGVPVPLGAMRTAAEPLLGG
ncbi:shikimate dehydrogenase [Spongisporangium articulatum]|uniref:shikimate dehydrogenase (NADP(+)) n=1 Tax=Spongisporangium articulatum TaxID=3362603 RepID=A0ABW8AR96_9ACTN